MNDWSVNKKRRYMDSKQEEDSQIATDMDMFKIQKCASESDSSSCVTRKKNHIYYYARVSKKSVYELNDHIVKINDDFNSLQKAHPEVKMTHEPIYLHINSYGGSVFAAFAAIDFIKQSKIPVHTIVEGATASAGTIMSVVGKKRYMRPTASMLIHQLSSWCGGKMAEIDDEYQNLEQMMEMIYGIYIENTNMNKRELKEHLSHDLWWKYDKCLEKGMVDELWLG